MSAALVVGGTGMLAGATRGLAARGLEVALLARGAPAFCEGHSRLHPYAADWSIREAFLAALAAASAAHGPFALALVWTHDRPRGLALDIAQVLSKEGGVARYFHVLGSAVSDPSNADALGRARAAFEAVIPSAWRPICLGFVTEGAKSRWLTNEEISAGVLKAIDEDPPALTIGTTRPWDRRP